MTSDPNIILHQANGGAKCRRRGVRHTELRIEAPRCGQARNRSFHAQLPPRRLVLPNLQRSAPKNSSHESKSEVAVKLATFSIPPGDETGPLMHAVRDSGRARVAAPAL